MIILFCMCGSRKFRPYGRVEEDGGPIINVFFTEGRHGPPSMGRLLRGGPCQYF